MAFASMKNFLSTALFMLLVFILVNQAQCDEKQPTINDPTSSSTSTPDSPSSETLDKDEQDDGKELKGEFENKDYKNAQNDTHIFYKPEYIKDPARAMSYWVDFGKLNPKNVTTLHDMLSKSHRRAAPAKLSFDFPFYGHPIRSVIVATGGFLYVGEHLHHWLAATQNISPLMANFDLSSTNYSDLHHYDNGTAYTVQWKDVQMKDFKPPGNFSFQVTLLKNGDIIFVYKNLPVPIQDIPEDDHPVKVGISDAFLMDQQQYFIRRKTIYDYHRLNMKDFEIKNETAIYLKALPTCNQFYSCESCSKQNPEMKCIWCPAVNRCSNGLDRKRQEWLKLGCASIKQSDCSNPTLKEANDDRLNQKSASSLSPSSPFVIDETDSKGKNRTADSLNASSSQEYGTHFMLTLFVVFALISCLAMWADYAYQNPHTRSGQFLIKYRPSMWRMQSSENRYTSASIHM